MALCQVVLLAIKSIGEKVILALCQLVLLAIKSMGEKVIFSMTFSPVFIFFFN